MIKKGFVKPFIILAIFMILACLYFWTSSRYPELSGKAMMGDHPSLSGLGFSAHIVITEDFSFIERVLAETVNWMHTNKRGMSFSFVMGAALLSLLPLFNRRAFKSGLGNSILGMAIGTPLGVCVNCAAPIARALHGGGASIQTSLAALISSPTFNIVVLTMAFSMFPLYAVILKIILTMVFILVLIPLGCHYLFSKEINKHQTAEPEIGKDECEDVKIGGWVHAIGWSLKTYLKNFLYLLKIALPLMILAGFLGAILVVVSPFSSIANIDQNVPLYAIIVILVLLAILGTFLPSPMAFDVILSASLLHAGVPIQYVAVFLFTLGSFSIYAFLIVWKAISFRVAMFLFLSTVSLGVVMGVACMLFDDITIKNAQEIVQNNKTLPFADADGSQNIALETNEDEIEQLSDSNAKPITFIGSEFAKANSENAYDPITNRKDKVFLYSEIEDELKANQIAYQPLSENNIVQNDSNLDVTWLELEKSPKTGEKLFSDINSQELGIIQPYNISYVTALSDAVPLYTMSVATGDVHKDGWPDILVAGDLEVRPNLILYSNIGGKFFKRQDIPIPNNISEVILVSLADLNTDTWLDIIFTTYNGPRFVIYNREGEFAEENLKVLEDTMPGTTMSLSIDDIEGDGNLDIFVGNWSVGPRFVNSEKSRNALLKFENNGFKKYEISGVTGETLTSMFMDINGDGLRDLYIGNDFMQDDYSDVMMLGQKSGMLSFIGEGGKLNGMLGSQSTMSIDIGDVNNDGLSDYYIGQIAYSDPSLYNVSKLIDTQIPYRKFCDQPFYKGNKEVCEKEVFYKQAIAKSAYYISDACQNLKDEKTQAMCLTHFLAYKYSCYAEPQAGQIDYKESTSKRYKEFCLAVKQAEKDEAGKYNKDKLLKSDNLSKHNLLLMGNENSSESKGLNLKNEAIARNVDYGAWTWNSRFADLDNDQWQDLYMVNGSTVSLQLPTNLFYHNDGNGYFKDHTKQSGLEDYTITSAFSFADFDNDGDLDIVTVPTDAPIKFYRNNSQNKSIQLFLEDNKSNNTQAIGSKVTISYNDNGVQRTQTRWVNLGGGYKSYNQMILHFGMKDIDMVDKITINWRDGKESVIKGSFETNKRYKIRRPI